MGFFYEKIARPMFFRLDCEPAHELAVMGMSLLGKLPPLCRALEAWNRVPRSVFSPVRVFGLEFPNAVGLAAGFDKGGTAWPAAAAMGFGHAEIGTVTALAQPGNPKPRMFRYPAQEAVINRMGFNNDGAENLAKRLARLAPAGRRRVVLGINLGKSKVASLEEAVGDYLKSFALLADHADYVAINVSSPNTPDLRKLQEKDRLEGVLRALCEANAARAVRRPLLLKIAPDLSWSQIDDVLETILGLGLDGIIATNTTLARPGFFETVNETGGLSGAPVERRATEIINYISRATHGRLPIIGVGGIMDVRGACEKLDAGASLVQVYTGMIYRGPFFAAQIARAAADRQRKGW
ncbi:quinone-dependent dihydroorotate dehydrogenase [Opitutaceae bacterium TAV4]|nr:quinone-dependent dihydroorotate dehydrogenase [Opitutaceae bacterium TAV4]RRK01663.1 quinone-dependent dihydroorotate dehydrogenase [Opitutaceae bacterium TAV3]